jgi:hypothetical protein
LRKNYVSLKGVEFASRRLQVSDSSPVTSITLRTNSRTFHLLMPSSCPRKVGTSMHEPASKSSESNSVLRLSLSSFRRQSCIIPLSSPNAFHHLTEVVLYLFRAVFWVILPCRMIVDRRFRGAYCLHHQG